MSTAHLSPNTKKANATALAFLQHLPRRAEAC